ncbi:MAG: hypothetical protein ABIG69_18070 [Bacteroidota bacterium]
MKTKMSIMLFLIYLFLPGWAFTQSFEKTIEYDQDSKIIDITSSENYYCISIESRNRNYFVDVLNKRGKKVFSKNASGYIQFGYVLEPENYFILINDEYDKNSDTYSRARAYSLETDELIWQTNFFSGPIELSPNGRLVLNKSQASFWDGAGPLSIINLANGKMESFPELINVGHAFTWFGDSKIALAKKQWIPNPEYVKFQNKIKQKSDQINEEIKEIKIAFHNGKISLDECNALKKAKMKEMFSLSGVGEKKARSEVNSRNKSTPEKKLKRTIQIASKLSIFDINNASIEISLDLFDKEGKPIVISGHNAGEINANKDGSIYILGSTMPFSDKLGDQLFKLDNSGRILWSTKPVEGKISLIRYNMSELLFEFKNSNGFSLVDNKTGVFVEELDIPNEIKLKLNFSKDKYNYKFNTFSNLNYDQETNRIITSWEEK